MRISENTFILPFVHHLSSHQFLANLWFLILCPCVLIMVESSNFTQPAIPILIGHYIIQLCQWRIVQHTKEYWGLLWLHRLQANPLKIVTFVKNFPLHKPLIKLSNHSQLHQTNNHAYNDAHQYHAYYKNLITLDKFFPLIIPQFL